MKHRFQKGDRVRVVRIIYGNPKLYEALIGEEFEIAECLDDLIGTTPLYSLTGRDDEGWLESELELVEETDIPAAPPLSDLFG